MISKKRVSIIFKRISASSGCHILLAWFLLFTVTSASTCTAQEQSSLTIRIPDKEFPPQYFKGKEGTWTGLDVELARLLVTEAGYAPKFVQRPWSRALRVSLLKGTLQIMANLSITKERSEFLHWIGPERFSEIALVVKKKDQHLPIHSLDDLIRVAVSSGKKFGIQNDAYYGTEFMKQLSEESFSKHFDPTPNAELNPRKVRGGRIIGFFEDKATMAYQIRNNKEYQGLVVHDFTLTSDPVFFGISKKGVSYETYTKLQQTFNRLEKQGRFDEIRDRHW